MKKYVLILSLVMVLLLSACGNKIGKMVAGSDNSETEEPVQEDLVAKKENEIPLTEQENAPTAEGEDENLATEQELSDVTLQVLKIDEEEGITLDNNEIYQTLQSEVDADPKMGVPNDFSLFPYDIVYYEDGSLAVLFLAINRLDRPIRNMAFDLTFGNQDGEYIFENEQIDLPNEMIGTIEKDGVVPIFYEISESDEDLFYSLDQDNLHLVMDNFKIDFVE